jgi:glycolate oxidase FAD binding subunit
MTAGTKLAAARLAEIVGDSNFFADPARLAEYEIDGIRPSAAVRPGSSEEVADVVKFAAAEKLAVIASGARTKLGIGLPPRSYDLALDLTRLDRVISYDPGDLTLSVEAGISLRKLAGVLGERGQFLPLAVPFFGRATIGGTVASGVNSPLRQFYGTARDYILGMQFVTGEGTLAKSGGRVVKNVTGYDIHKLMIGALGTLGVVTKVNFRTFPLPVGSRAFVANFETAERALEMRARVAQSPLTPITMEVLSPGVAGLFYSDAAAGIEAKPFATKIITNKTWAFSAGFAGTEKVLDRCEAEARAIAGQCGAVGVTALAADHIPGAFGRKREFIPIALDSSPAATILKISVLPSKLKDVLAETGAAAESDSLRWAAMARGIGVAYVALLPESKTDSSRAQVARAADRIQAACARLEGHATIPWCPTEWKPSLKIWGLERADLPQMRKVKAVFDPNGVLSPGRFVGGL